MPTGAIDGVLLATVDWVLDLLVSGRYEELERISRGNRLTASEIRSAVDQYGRKLIKPPKGYAPNIIEIQNSAPQQWAVVIDLWTDEEEQRSDLSLELTVTASPAERYEVEIDDLHVL